MAPLPPLIRGASLSTSASPRGLNHRKSSSSPTNFLCQIIAIISDSRWTICFSDPRITWKELRLNSPAAWASPGATHGWRIGLWPVVDGWFSGTWHGFRGKAGVQACLMGGYSIARLRGDGRKGNAQPKISWRSPPIAPGRAELRVRPVSSIGADNNFKAFTLANFLK